MILVIVLFVLSTISLLQGFMLYRTQKHLAKVEQDLEAHYLSIMRLNKRTLGTTTSVSGIAKLPDKLI